jgi:protocatechuate 3,4-dioxygenase beta subunit
MPHPPNVVSRREALGLASGLLVIGLDDGCKGGDTAGDTEQGETDTNTTVGWASGGTASMTGTYPDPFTALGTACALTCHIELGPCYGETLERKDISEAYPTGLPVRLAFRVVDESCTPVAGAIIDIWHTAPNGLYSGANVTPTCTRLDADMMAHHYFRGFQSTDANGRVDFDTCFPGWYPDRTLHIHVQIRKGTDEYATTQLFFQQPLIDEICTTHPDYVDHGEPEMSNADDHDFADAYTFATAKMPDGAMQASATIVIRSALTDTLCEGA